MASIPEINEFTPQVYQLEITDPVEGGELGIANFQARALANRTLWLKNRSDDLETAIDGVADDLAEEVLDRLAAEAEIYTYLPKKRGYFSTLDIAGMSVGDTMVCVGNFSSAVITADGSVTSVVRVTMSGTALPNTNYHVEIGLQCTTGDINNHADIYAPVYKIISPTQFDIIFREADSGTVQSLKVHLKVFSLNF